MAMVLPARKQRARAVPRLLCIASLCAVLACKLVGHVREESQPAFLGFGQGSVKQAVLTSFPGAMPGGDVADLMIDTVQKHGVKKHNVVYGQSICSDEINSDPGHLSTVLTKYFGRAFPLGGIGGAPYVGKTGFMAFSHHVPTDGHVVIIFGPHIGFSPDGEAGKFLRKGQQALSTSCGAVIAAFGQCTSGKRMSDDAKDMEQSWLRNKLAPHCKDVAASDNPMVDLVMNAYKKVEEEMLSIVNTDFGSGNLVLLGGIQINMPYPASGYFMPMHFSIRSAGKGVTDLMGVFS